MFTGLIKDIGEILTVRDKGGLRRLVIGTHLDVNAMDIGASVACDGCCLTVVDREAGGFAVEVSNETMDVTTIGTWAQGAKINLEPSLRLGDEMGGHIVSGHVDGLATLVSVTPDGESFRLSFEVPLELAGFIAPKGSIALNGISLTVNEVGGTRFGVNIIPHTWQVTNIKDWKPDDKINVEIDMLARYVSRMVDFKLENHKK
jgi:riboflavin synthase